MSTLGTVALAGLAVAALLCLGRLVRPGSIADRVVGLDTLIVVTVSGFAVAAIEGDDPTLEWVLVITSLLGFVATVTVARYIERRGAR